MGLRAVASQNIFLSCIQTLNAMVHTARVWCNQNKNSVCGCVREREGESMCVCVCALITV